MELDVKTLGRVSQNSPAQPIEIEMQYFIQDDVS